MDEYIKREAVLRAVQGQRGPCRSLAQNRMLDCLKAAVIRISAADVVPVVHSHWEHKIRDDGENIGICHNCKYPVNWFWGQTKYCPNCGAKMDEGADHEAD